MNPDTNRFEPLQAELEKLKRQFPATTTGLLRPDGTPVPAHWAVFRIGEHVVIKNYTFKVAYIGETAVLFEPIGVPLVGEGGPCGEDDEP